MGLLILILAVWAASAGNWIAFAILLAILIWGEVS